MGSDTWNLAKFISEVDYNDLPEEVKEKVKNILLDSIGCALGGYCTDKAKIMMGFVREMGGKPQASVIGGGKTSANLAAFANGELINSLDWDCIGPLQPHVIPFVLPPCIAVAEINHSTGKELILAAALAIEIGGRMGASVLQNRETISEPPYYKLSPRYSYSPAVFGGSAGACKILKMDSTKIANALGISGVSAPVAGMMKWQHIEGPSPMLKYNSWAGWIAQLGVTSALLANRGFTSDASVLDGDYGFWKMYGSPFFRKEVLFGDLGKSWVVMETEYKPYPSCRCNHGAIDGIVKLMNQNGISPEQISEIRVFGDSWLLHPSRSQTSIEGSVDTCFSVAYTFAMAAFFGGNPGPHWTMPIVYKDQRILEMMKKVKVDVFPDADNIILKNLKSGKAPVLWLARVEITANGRKYTTEVLEPWGKGENVFTEKDIEKKFFQNASFSPVPLPKSQEIVKEMKKLESKKDINEIMALTRSE